jgi:hypothetical protein
MEHGLIKTCIEKNRYIWSEYIINKLKEDPSIRLIDDIVKCTGKQLGEALMLLICIIRYIMNENDALDYLEKDDIFTAFLDENYQQILHIANEKNVQGNLPERGLPVMELIGKKLDGRPVSLLELGASYGLIGHCLLNRKTVLKNFSRYFPQGQQFPESPVGIERYLGIEIALPEVQWIFACLESSHQKKRLENFLEDVKPDDNFQIVDGSAFGFSGLDEVVNFSENCESLVILTSFMLYQFNREKQEKLKREIKEFTKKCNGNWISQVVDIEASSEGCKFFVEWNGEKVIRLDNDMCKKWSWL